MSNSTVSLRKKMSSAKDLQSVVRTMKAVAASSISQYEKSVGALNDYYHTVELGLSVCFNQRHFPLPNKNFGKPLVKPVVRAVVFGSDQGLVGQFNDLIAGHALKALEKYSGQTEVWAVGERVYGRLQDAGITLKGLMPVPKTVGAIAPMVGKILLESAANVESEVSEFYLFYNQSQAGSSYVTTSLRLFPFDLAWQKHLSETSWPTNQSPQLIGSASKTLAALIREYLFVALFRACAESLASENSSRLAAMQRAEKNIEDLLEVLKGQFHRTRQGGIDEELFDVVSGFEALKDEKKGGRP